MKDLMKDLYSNFKEYFMKAMKAEKMTNTINQIMDEVARDRDGEHYEELMTAAYNLWGFLYYDMGCAYPPDEIGGGSGKFEF